MISSGCTSWLLGGMLLVFVLKDSPAQVSPAATRRVQLSSFALLGDTYTGLSAPVTNLGGRNLSATLGADLNFLRFGGTSVALEVRGVYPLFNGHVDGQRSLTGGLRGQYRFPGARLARVQPYADVLAGRGSIEYVNGGYPTGNLLYTRSSSNVFTGGGGFEVVLTRRWSLLGDVQLSHWSTPVTASGTLHSVQGSGGVRFAFRFGREPH